MKFFKHAYFPYALSFFVFLVLCIINPDSGYDKRFDIWWSHEILLNGLPNIYQVGSVNYPPLVLYILWVFTLFFDHVNDINLDSINALKPIKIFFDFIILCNTIYLLKWFKIKWQNVFYFLFNLAFWYGSLFWAQYDSMVICFLLLSFTAIVKYRPTTAVVFFLLALNTKHIAVLAVPFLVLLLLNQIKIDWKTIKKMVLYGCLLQTLIFMPFIVTGHFSEAIDAIFLRTVSHHAQVSCNAQNIWVFLCEGDPFFTTDKAPFWGKTYLFYGLSFFLLSTTTIILPLVYKTWKKEKISFSIILLGFGLLTICFFYFNTEMHERYLHLPLVFLGIYSFLNSNPLRMIVFALFSILYFVSVEKILHFMSYLPLEYFNQKHYLALFCFEERFLSLSFLLVLLYYGYEYYQVLNKKEIND